MKTMGRRHHETSDFVWHLGVAAFSLAIACFRKRTDPQEERIWIVMLAWFLVWVALSRGGKRYDFFIGIPLAYGAAWLLWQLPVSVMQHLSAPVKPRWVTACFTLAVLISILFWHPLGGHATRAVAAAAKWRKPVPGHQTPLAQTLHWMKTTRLEDAVVAANWSYGK